MIRPLSLVVATALFALPALAEGDAAKGEKEFGKCKACHRVEAPDGTVIVKGTKTGPNLYGLIGRTAGTDDYAYGASLKQAGEKGLVWDEEQLVAYLLDPPGYLKTYLEDPAARTSMSFRLKKGGADIAAYLTAASAAE